MGGRLKHDAATARSARSIAERSYRAVMAENERLCNKLEHLEEVFVSGDGGQSMASMLVEENQAELRRLKQEKGHLQVALKKAQVQIAALQQSGEPMGQQQTRF